MRSVLKNKFAGMILLTAAVIGLVLSYSQLSKKIDISYYDEEYWVSGSYYFQFFIEGNLDSAIWHSSGSKDQPMLTRYVFAMWLYPEYFKEKLYNNDLDYTKFLIAHGFKLFNNIPKYKNYIITQGRDVPQLPKDYVGQPDDLIKKFGSNISRHIQLIQKAREINFIILALAVMVPTLFFSKTKGIWFSMLFYIFYGFNTLVVDNGVKAHSEALFLLLFNLAIIHLLLYFSNKTKVKYLFLFSVFTGLCFSTKPNGFIPTVSFLILEVLHIIKNKKWMEHLVDFVQKTILAGAISLGIFMSLNPIAYPNLIKGIYEMAMYKQQVINVQKYIYHQDVLENFKGKLTHIYNCFYGDKYKYVNSVKIDQPIALPKIILLTLFILGIIVDLKNNKQGKNLIAVFVVVFLTTLTYIQFSWQRYLVHLAMFPIYYQVSALYFLLQVSKSRINLFFNYIRSHLNTGA